MWTGRLPLKPRRRRPDKFCTLTPCRRSRRLRDLTLLDSLQLQCHRRCADWPCSSLLQWRVKSRYQYPGRERRPGAMNWAVRHTDWPVALYFMLFDVLGRWHEMSAWATLCHQSIEYSVSSVVFFSDCNITAYIGRHVLYWKVKSYQRRVCDEHSNPQKSLDLDKIVGNKGKPVTWGTTNATFQTSPL